MSDPQLMTVKQTSRRLAVSEATVYALISSGKLACHRVGVGRGVIRISDANVTDYLESTRSQPAGKPTSRIHRPRLLNPY